VPACCFTGRPLDKRPESRVDQVESGTGQVCLDPRTPLQGAWVRGLDLEHRVRLADVMQASGQLDKVPGSILVTVSEQSRQVGPQSGTQPVIPHRAGGQVGIEQVREQRVRLEFRALAPKLPRQIHNRAQILSPDSHRTDATVQR